jgi:hypothetical protein
MDDLTPGQVFGQDTPAMRVVLRGRLIITPGGACGVRSVGRRVAERTWST